MGIRSLRLLDKAGQLVRVLEEGEADSLLASGKVEIRKGGRRTVLVLLDSRTVRDFQRGSTDSKLGAPAIQSTYTETHRGQVIAMQKRASETVNEDGETATTLHKWDAYLTFAELRAGFLVSQTTRDKRADAEWRKKNLVAFLAYEEYERSQRAA